MSTQIAHKSRRFFFHYGLDGGEDVDGLSWEVLEPELSKLRENSNDELKADEVVTLAELDKGEDKGREPLDMSEERTPVGKCRDHALQSAEQSITIYREARSQVLSTGMQSATV